jgi:phosphatidylserine synthase
MKTIVIDTKSRIYTGLINTQYKNLTIPNLISYFTLIFSLGGIYLLLNGHSLLGALLLWTICDVFDTLDGFVARKFNMFSPLGADLDSLIDVITFLIPPFLISLQSGNDFLLISAFFFVFSGIYRLARFNVEKNAKGVVVGLQASLAAHLVYFSVLINVPSYYLSIIFIIVSFLMISPVKSKGKHSLYLTALLMTLNTLLIVLKLV